MGLILNKYDEENRIDYCFYDSSNVLYSECYDKPNELKDVKVVFSGGQSYIYKSVDVNDYLLFRQNTSQGKSLFKYLALKKNGVNKYETIKLENTDLIKLNEFKQQLLLELEENNKKEVLNEEENE